MPFKDPSGSFVHAAHYAELLLRVGEHLFPGEKFFSLSQDQRRIVDNETSNLLVYSRWKVDSLGFAEHFAQKLIGGEEAPAGIVLGNPLEAPSPEAAIKPPGQFL